MMSVPTAGITPSGTNRQVLLLSSDPGDARRLAEMLAGAGIGAIFCKGVDDFCSRAEDGAPVGILDSEQLDDALAGSLGKLLASSPPGRPFRLILLLPPGGDAEPAAAGFSDAAGILPLVRPVARATLIGAVRLALPDSATEQAGLAAEALLESISDAFFAIDRNWRFTYLNSQAERLLRRKRKELLGSGIWDEFPEAVGSLFDKEYRRAMRRRESRSFEAFYPPLETWFEVHVYPTTEGLSVFFADINARKKAEEDLRKANEVVRRSLTQFDALIQQMTEGLVIFDPQGNLLDMNPAALEIHGFDSVQGLRRHLESLPDIFELFDLEGNPLPLENWPIGRVLRGESFRSQEVEVRRRDTGRAWIGSYGGTPVLDRSGNLLLAIVTLRDVTGRKRIERALRESEERFRQTFENAGVGMAHVDLDGRFLRINRRLCEITGYPPQELVGKTFQEITHPGDLEADLEQAGRLLAGDLAVYRMEKRYLRRDGTAVWVHLTGSLQRDLRGEPLYFIAAIQDITRQKELEEELRRAKEAAEAGSRAKSAFLANMSHEIRTPLTGIMGMLELTLQTGLSPDRARYLEMALESSRSLLRLINDILDVSKIEAGVLELERKPFAPVDWIRATAELFRPLAEAKGLALAIDLDETIPSLVIGDPDRLRQVLVNLLGNAVKFTDHGTVGLAVASEPTAEQERARLRFEVWDTGIGIPREKRNRIFSSFSQADSSYARRYGGSGLGLAISRDLVERMGGKMDLRSRRGMGSRFFFALDFPLPDREDRQPGPAVKPGEPAPGPAPSARILVVEDDPTIRELVEMILKGRGWKVSTARGGRDALELWEPGRFDLVLMDVQMPGMDGLEATRRLRERQGSGERTPIVAMTAHARPEDREICLQAGMDDYISKPIDIPELFRLVERHLEAS